MFTVGCHLSFSKGFMGMAREALSLGGSGFQFFTGNPRGYAAKEWSAKDIKSYNAFAAANGIGVIIAHAPYVYNLCAAKEEIRQLSFDAMKNDLRKLEAVDNAVYNFHPGSHVGQGTETGAALIADALNRLETGRYRTPVLLETMAGKGSEVGARFEELAAILARVEDNGHLGVCLDTCHVFDGGYDIVNDLNGVLAEFDKIVGLDRLKAIHLNDSKNPLGSRKDRHEKLGEGCIGLEPFRAIVNHPALRDLPFCLETPNEAEGYAKEIAVLRKMRAESGVRSAES